MPAKLLNVLNKLGEALNAELDLDHLVKLIVEHGTELTDAKFGAFFYHTSDHDGSRLDAVAVHGADIEEFRGLGRLSATPLLSAHLETGFVRIPDVFNDPLYGQNSHRGLPTGHLPVRSYMAVPVSSRNGTRIGSLLFGHPNVGVFTETHEQVVIGLAAMAAVAMDNASLYLAAQREIVERREAELALRSALDRQKLLLDELNHRVKNTLATIQSIAIQTRNSIAVKYDNPTIDQFYDAFESRLLSLSRAHDLLVLGAWVGVDFEDAVRAAINPSVIDSSRVSITGSSNVVLSPNAVVTLNMVFHELTTNAVKYGALSNEEGTIRIDLKREEGTIAMTWKEVGGPKVSPPMGSGFGTRLIERGAMRELGGSAKLLYEPDGLKCIMNIPVSAKVSVIA
jgi:two-component sensor histidine kinase